MHAERLRATGEIEGTDGCSTNVNAADGLPWLFFRWSRQIGDAGFDLPAIFEFLDPFESGTESGIGSGTALKRRVTD